MEKQKFLAMLSSRDDFVYHEPEDGKSVVVGWYREPSAKGTELPDTETRLDNAAIERLGARQLMAACKQGRDVDHITRVTGYFSHTSRWNPGKKAELKERARVTVVKQPKPKIEGDAA